MAKLSKSQCKAHAEAEAILTKEILTDDERDFVIENWHEGACFTTGVSGAFFTPCPLASDFALDVGGGHIIDLCAGIGTLAYFAAQARRWGNSRITDITCIEINPRYVEVGRKLLPEARWLHADIFNWKHLDLGHYDSAIANPPFGRVRRAGNGPRYRGPEFEFHVIDIAAELADCGTFLIPQNSASFRYSGAPYFDRLKIGKGRDFERQTMLTMDAGVGVDTSIFRDQWKDTSIICEIACFDFAQMREQRRSREARMTAKSIADASCYSHQLALI